MDVTDRETVRAYRNGDVDAMHVLVEKYRKPLFGYLLSMVASQHEAEEVFQETWLRVIRKIHLYRDKNFFAWVVRIARNIVYDRYRRHKPVLSLDEEAHEGLSRVDSIEGNEPLPSDRAQHSELGDRIRAAVRQLPDEQREVFLMRVEAGLAFKDIARAQGVSINTALARMQYALKHLRPMLADDAAVV